MIWSINTLSFNFYPKSFLFLFNKILYLLWRSCVKTCFWTWDIFSFLSRPSCWNWFISKYLWGIDRSKWGITRTIFFRDVKLVVNWGFNLNVLNHFLIILKIVFTVVCYWAPIELTFNKPFRCLCWVWFDIRSWFQISNFTF